MERLEYDLLFRWFVGLRVDEPVRDHSTFSENRDRLLDGDVAARFFTAILAQARLRRLLSSDHFSVDGTLVDVWASMKSFRPRDEPDRPDGDDGGRNPSVDFRAEKRSNAAHASTTDPDAMPSRMEQGMEAGPCYIGHGLMENRSELIVDARLTRVSGHAERLAALEMIEQHADRPLAITPGADRGYDAADFVEELRKLNVRRHVAQNVSRRRSPIDRRTTRHAGDAAGVRARTRTEAPFGWIKTVAGLRRTKLRGLVRVDWSFTFASAAYNLVRLPTLLGASARAVPPHNAAGQIPVTICRG